MHMYVYKYENVGVYVCMYVCIYTAAYLLKSEGQVSIRMQPDYLWRVNVREFRNIAHKIFHLDKVGNAIHEILLWNVYMYT